MPMTVMNVGEMRMRVRNGQMDMRMGMRFVAAIREVVPMSMMFVVAMPVNVLQQIVSMLVLMPLAHMQPNAQRHQHCGTPEKHGR